MRRTASFVKKAKPMVNNDDRRKQHSQSNREHSNARSSHGAQGHPNQWAQRYSSSSSDSHTGRGSGTEAVHHNARSARGYEESLYNSRSNHGSRSAYGSRATHDPREGARSYEGHSTRETRRETQSFDSPRSRGRNAYPEQNFQGPNNARMTHRSANTPATRGHSGNHPPRKSHAPYDARSQQAGHATRSSRAGDNHGAPRGSRATQEYGTQSFNRYDADYGNYNGVGNEQFYPATEASRAREEYRRTQSRRFKPRDTHVFIEEPEEVAPPNYEPRAALDMSLDNSRWYSRGENDVNQGRRVGRHGTINSSPSLLQSLVEERDPKTLAIAIVAIVLLFVGIFFASTAIINALNPSHDSGSDQNNPAATDTMTQTNTVKVSFAGDCTLGTDVSFDKSTSWNTKYSNVEPSYFFQNVKSIFDNDDLTVVNMEGTLTTSNDRQDKTFAFKGDADYAKVLAEGGVQCASLANNHSRDYGEQSYTDTITAMDNAGVPTFGYDRIYYTDVNGVKVALIGTYMLAEGIGVKDSMVQNINTAKENGAQLIMVYVHWGTEREYVPDVDQIQLAHAAVDAGADLVIGSHPHVIQGYEKYNGRYIVYSLGNFCFGGNKNPSDKDCMIFQQTFQVTGNDVATDDNINVIPCSISSTSSANNYQPTPQEGEEANRIMAKINKSNASIESMSKAVQNS